MEHKGDGRWPVAAIVPAYNEEQRIGSTVRALIESGAVAQVIVVDDGSTDRTAAVATEAGAAVIRHSVNEGKSAALNAGVTQCAADILLLVDADLGHTARETIQLLRPVQDGQADMTIASWPKTTGGGFGFVKRLGGWFIRRCTGKVMNSPLSGQRAMRRHVWSCWRGSKGFGFEVALTIDVLQAGYRVLEVPVNLSHREHGRTIDGFVHRGKQAWHLVLTMLQRGWQR